MRLAYLCNVYPAVSHSFVRREIEAIEAAGHEVHRFSIRTATKGLRDKADIREASVTENVLDQGAVRLISAWLALLASSPKRSFHAASIAWRLSGAGLKTKIRHFAYLLEAAWLTRRLASLGVQHLHAHFGTNPAAVAMLVRAFGGPPFSFTAHGPDEFDAPLALSLSRKVEAANFVVAISSYCRSQLMRWSPPEHWEKIRVIRCGVDSSFFGANPQPPLSDSKEFVCVARLSAQKGLPLLIAACDGLRSKGHAFTLRIVGDGEMRHELSEDICRRGLEDAISLVGVRSSEEIREYLLQARAFVLPSFAEGLPVVLMEALVMERPVITTSIAGIPELVDEKCGWIIPAGDEQALTEAMASALNSPAEDLKRRGAVGRKRVQLLHDASRNSHYLVGAIAQTLSATRSGSES